MFVHAPLRCVVDCKSIKKWLIVRVSFLTRVYQCGDSAAVLADQIEGYLVHGPLHPKQQVEMRIVKDFAPYGEQVRKALTGCEFAGRVTEPVCKGSIDLDDSAIDGRGQVTARSAFIELFCALLEGRLGGTSFC